MPGIRYQEVGRGSGSASCVVSPERTGSLFRTGGAASPAGDGNQPAGLAAPGRLGRALALPETGAIRDCSRVPAPYPDVP